jgi:nucleotide-binding universal stress UspA family protein
MFQRVLVPLDGSVRAEQALPVAVRLARAMGGSLLLVQVVSPPLDFSGGMSPAPLMTDQVVESEMADASDYLKAVTMRPELAEIKVTTEVLFGIPAQLLIQSARVHRSDFVVLCSHGRTGLTRWALGSVAHTLVHQSDVPVLVLRQDDMLAHVEERPLRTLVPLDGSELAEAALAPAATLTAALTAPARGELRLVQVVKSFHSTTEEGLVSESNKETRQQARSYLATVAERVQTTEMGCGLAVTFAVELASDVASALLGVAEQAGAGGSDLIAISTHGRTGLERWVMGSVTQRLLNTTTLPILIVQPQRKR